MTECDERPQHVENNARAQKAVIVQFSEVFDRRDPSLVGAVNVLFQTPPDIFQDLVNNRDDEVGVIPVQVIRKHCHKPDIAIIEFPRFRE